MLYIIFEGPDRAGKTTTRKLVEKLRDGKDIVIDRFIGSNIVYGKVFDRYTEKEIAHLYHDELMFAKTLKPVLIFLNAPLGTIKKRLKSDNHEKINTNILNKALSEYHNYYVDTFISDKLSIDTSKYTQTEVVGKIISYLIYVENKRLSSVR